MASATVPQTATRPKGRRKPDPQRILQVYEYEKRTHGARGAYRRAGEMLGVSDETVRRAVHAAEAPPAEPTPAELVYVPPPGGYPEPEPLPQMAQDGASSDARNDTDEPQIEAADIGDITSSDDATIALESPEPALPHEPTPQAEDATRHADERDEGEHSRPALPQTAPPIVQRVVVREVQTVGLLEWARQHEVLSKQLVALGVFLLLVLLSFAG